MAVNSLHSQGSYGLGQSGSSAGFTLGVQFSVSQSCTLTGIWFFSGAAATSLPTACCLWNASTGTQIAGTLNSSPSWSGAAGSGWVKCTYSGPTLSTGINYVSSVFFNGGTLNWFYDVNGYWTSGAGSGGITSGVLSAPNSAGSVNGQAPFVSSSGSIGFPNTSNSGFDFGVDVEVTTSSNVTGTLSLAMAAMAESLTGSETISGTLSEAMAPMRMALTGHETGVNVTGTASLAMAPMRMLFNGRKPTGQAVPDTDDAREFKRWLIWEG